MESLIKNGEEWMSPLLKYRDLLAFTTDPVNKDTYRNYKRRTGKVSYQYAKDGEDRSAERKHVPGPYWLKYRQQWLKDLLEIERDLNAQGHRITLITESELHAIRQEWLKDPNEPDWYDTLPGIYREVYQRDLDWVVDDQSRFDASDADLLVQIAQGFDVVPEMVMKLIELEVSMEGLSRRQGIFDKLGTILKQDWGSLEEIQQQQAALQKRNDRDIHQEEITRLEAELQVLQRRIVDASESSVLVGEENGVLIKQLVLHNFRVFNGTHTIDLAPRKRPHEVNPRPIVLFGGLNGAGKTSILSAIRLALYGRLAFGLATQQQDYIEHLSSLIHKGAYYIEQPEEAAVELTFTYNKGGQESEFTVTRTWKKGKKDRLSLQKDGNHSVNWIMISARGFLMN